MSRSLPAGWLRSLTQTPHRAEMQYLGYRRLGHTRSRRLLHATFCSRQAQAPRSQPSQPFFSCPARQSREEPLRGTDAEARSSGSARSLVLPLVAAV